MDPKARVASGLQALLSRLPAERELDAFSRYLSLLVQWNRVHSLTAYREPDEIIEKLFLDSLLFLPLLPAGTGRLLDVGSGAGIPGIPLKIVEPRYRLTLIEARRRRTSFLATVVRELHLQNVQVLTGRAEALIDEYPSLGGAFDAVVTRASGRLDLVIPLALRFLKPGGRFIASGPPKRKSQSVQGSLEPWQAVVSPVSGLPRQFLSVEKKLDRDEGQL